MENPSITKNKTLAKRISRVEVAIIMILVLVWISIFALIHTQKTKYVNTMLSLQKGILTVAKGTLTPQMDAGTLSWPFTDTFYYLVITDGTITISNHGLLQDNPLSLRQAFGDFSHGQEMIKHVQRRTQGTDWIKRDRMASRQWISWSVSEDGSYTLGIIADEEDLLKVSGFHGYRVLLVVCACLVSALLLMALIWALSWMRLSAVKGLSDNP